MAGSASLTATCTTACGSSWSATVNNGRRPHLRRQHPDRGDDDTASIDAAGNVGTLGFLPGNTSGGSSVGGSLNFVQFNTNTIAGVSDGASLRAADDIAVNAITSDQFVAVAPSSGKAGGALALNGITSLGFLNNTTHASISSQASVFAPTLNILAQQDLSVVIDRGRGQCRRRFRGWIVRCLSGREYGYVRLYRRQPFRHPAGAVQQQ